MRSHSTAEDILQCSSLSISPLNKNMYFHSCCYCDNVATTFSSKNQTDDSLVGQATGYREGGVSYCLYGAHTCVGCFIVIEEQFFGHFSCRQICQMQVFDVLLSTP